MSGMIRKFAGLSVVLAVFTLGACESSLHGPEVEGPQMYMMLDSGTDQASGGGTSLRLPRAKSYPSTTTVSQVIDQAGGQIQVADWVVLNVSPGAVREAARFTVEVIRNGYMEVRLTAIAAKGKKVDLGAAGFFAPVTLGLNTNYAQNVTDSSVLSLLWEVDGSLSGRLSPVPGSLRNGHWMVTTLAHFSEYVMASN